MAVGGLVVLALLGLLTLTTVFWPFQTAVQVIAPFIAVSILSSVGATLILTAFLLPRTFPGAGPNDATGAIDSLLSESKRRG